jgi:hypothetical protein
MEYISYKKNTDIFEESQQLQLCCNLLSAGNRVYVEPNRMIPTSLVTELDQHFGELIQFESLQWLDDHGIEVYKVPM